MESNSLPFYEPTGITQKRKREPFDYREQRPPKHRRKDIADYRRCSAQQRHIYESNSLSSPLLSLPPEIRNEIYGHVLSDNVIHMSVRECPADDPCSWSHSDYYRKAHVWWDRLNCGSNAFLKFTHTLCTLPFDEEDQAHTRAHNRQPLSLPPATEQAETTYHTRHKPCYRALAHLKANWLREGQDVTISPFYHPAHHPGLPVQFLQTSRQIYTETRDLLYTSNTFAFHEGHTLDLFLSKCLSASQRKLITSVQLDGWMSEDFDPGSTVRAETLRRLSGLRRLAVVVTNAHSAPYRLHTFPARGANKLELEPRSLGREAETGGGKGSVVRVTVDRLAGARSDPVELEQLVRMKVLAGLYP